MFSFEGLFKHFWFLTFILINFLTDDLTFKTSLSTSFFEDEGLLVDKFCHYLFLTPLPLPCLLLFRCQYKCSSYFDWEKKSSAFCVMKTSCFKLQLKLYLNHLSTCSRSERNFQSALIWCQNVHTIWINKGCFVLMKKTRYRDKCLLFTCRPCSIKLSFRS